MDEKPSTTITNEQIIKRIRIRPESIIVRKDNLFTNARTTFHDEPLASLEKSIAEIGLLKPITVERDSQNPNRFILLAGERRYICVTNLKKKNLACKCTETGGISTANKVYEFVDVKIVYPKNDLERLRIMIAENAEHSQVPDWDYFQYAIKLDSQTDGDGNKKFSREDLCEIFNRSPAWMSHTMSISKLPNRVKECLKKGTLNRTGAVDLLSAKSDKIEFVLKYAENVVIRQAKTNLEKAQEEIETAEIELEIADQDLDSAVSIGDRLAARYAEKQGHKAKKKIANAESHIEKEEELLSNPIVITEESIKQTFEENPDTIKDGVSPKTRSPKRIRSQLKEMQALLEEQIGEQCITDKKTGKYYSREHVLLVLAAYEQMLGKKPLSIFDLLDEEYIEWGYEGISE